MKTKLLLTLLFSCFFYVLSAQVPQGFNYQAIARSSNGKEIVNTALQIRISILSDTNNFFSAGSGTYLWEEQHSVTTNSFGLFSLIVGNPSASKVQGSAATFSVINWNAAPLFLGTKIQYQGNWVNMGTSRFGSVPYAAMTNKLAPGNTINGVNFDGSAPVTITANAATLTGTSLNPAIKNSSLTSVGTLGTLGVTGTVTAGRFAGPFQKLAVKGSVVSPDSALFEVKNSSGQTVFAVYPEAVNIFVPNSAKGTKGGFAIGGFENVKGSSQDYFRVTPDSVRVYINNNPPVGKGNTKGGFAIGGFDETKGYLSNYFMNVTGANAVNTVDSASQILWYPNKQAFLAGRISILSADSVGTNSTALGYKSRAIGNYSQAFGYRTTARGDYSTAIGKLSVAGSRLAGVSTASNAFAFGNSAYATGNDSYAFGSGAIASGVRSIAFGSVGVDSTGTVTSTPTRASGSYSTAIGMGAQAQSFGTMALGVGSIAYGYSAATLGYYSNASGNYSLALGYKATTSTTGIYANAIGYYASASNTYSNAFGYFAAAKGYGSLSLGYNSVATGSYSTALGYNSQAVGDKSMALGSQYTYTIRRPLINRITGQIIWLTTNVNKTNTATRSYSLAIGNGNTAQDGGTAIGSNNSAMALGSVALGHTNWADTSYSFAAGYGNYSYGFNAFALGENVTAQAANSFVIGTYNNLTGDKYNWVDTDPLFVIGNGESGATHDALKVLKNGATYIYPVDATYGLYNYSTNPAKTSTSYGLYNYVSNNSSNTGNLYSGYFYSYQYGSGVNYGLRSVSYGSPTSTNSIYSGYFSGSTNGGSGTYWGLYADVRSGAAIDLAEYIYDSNGDTGPADVVVADPAKKESVIKSSKPYQTSVVGVISTKPHLIMGMELITDVKTGEPLTGVSATRLALSGRVPVNVTGENGPIVPGDYLTTSSTPGCSMKWTLLDVNSATDFADLKRILAENEKRRNAIIGKAVESFSGSGSGKIMVLISLQ
jgi:hypothetical protein